jgi:Domain of unknown function (DUF4864)
MHAFLVMALVLIGSTLFARADDDVVAGQTVIRSQEQAFARDDADTAYTFAAPSIQSVFRTSESFMYMVRNGYAPVYRHQSFEFGEAKFVDGKIVQAVHIIDAEGAAWEALYYLEPQGDGSLKISGCILKKEAMS